jgi:hypothetical protein
MLFSGISPSGAAVFLQVAEWYFSKWRSDISPSGAVVFLQVVQWYFSK